jgi:hypothetical protein
MRFIGSALLLGALLTGAYAQRPRTMDTEPTQKAATAPVPTSVKAKYEGGVFGYTKAMDGTLTFDDANSQLLFKDKKTPKEIHIPYDAVTSVYAGTKKSQPGAAKVAGQVPLIYTFPAKFIKTKGHYLTVQYSDPDSRQNGITTFKLDEQILNSILLALVEKTGMTQRGDIYVKKKEVGQVNP